MFSGVYEIVNTVNGKRYVGSAVRFSRRWGAHRQLLNAGKHNNIHLQRAWDKYGKAAFEFRKLLICKPEHLLDYEQRCLDVLKPEYNLTPTAGSQLGYRHTAETRVKMSTAHLGKPNGRLGKKHTTESRVKMSAAHLGKKHNEESRIKIAAARLGKKYAADTCARISAANLGRKHTLESCAMMAAAQRGKKLTIEHRAKISAAHLGKKHTAETCVRMQKSKSTEARARMVVAQQLRRCRELGAVS